MSSIDRDAAFRQLLATVRQRLPEELSEADWHGFLSRNAPALRRQLDEALDTIQVEPGPLVPKGTELYPIFADQGAPSPGERGYRPPHAPLLTLAEELLDRARKYLDDTEFFWAWESARKELAGGGDEYGWVIRWDDEEDDDPAWSADDLLWLLGVPESISSRRLSRRERLNLAMETTQLAMEVEGKALARASLRTGQLASWVAVGLLADVMAPLAPLRLVNVDKTTAAAFIEKHHALLPCYNPKGLMYSLGAEVDGRLVAVATAGHPSGPWRRVDPRNVLEVTRVASDRSTKNAASMLVARLLDLRERSRRGRPDQPALFVTYQVSDAEGSMYAALQDKGLRRVLYRPPRKRASGARAHGKPTPCQQRTGVINSLADVGKWRWEAA